MKKWFLGLLSGFFLAFLLLIAAGLSSWYLRERPPSVPANSTLVVEIEGDLPERAPADLPGQLLGRPGQLTLLSVVRNIEKAALDRRITAILLKPRGLQLGWAKLQQLRHALDDFREHGKKLTAVLDVAGSREYYLASAAQDIVLSPAGILDVKGMRAEVMFFKDGLAKLGVQADLEQIGAYKNFADQFKDNRMSDAFREATTSMLDSIYNSFIQAAADARGKTFDEMRTVIEETGPFEPERAVAAGLVDDLRYEDEVLDRLRHESGDAEVRKISLADYARVPASSVGLDKGDRIALVYAVGDITAGETALDPMLSGETLGSKTMAGILESVAKDDSIKGVLVRIDSPGGDAFASDDIWRHMNLLRGKKPMVFSMSDTAASGGYYIAMTGDPIVAEPGTVTGSIGIVYGKLNLKGLYDKLGINKEIISRGRLSTMDSDYGPYSPAERERVRGLMDDFYQDFIQKVGTARKMTPEEVDRIAQGRVWTGEQALQNGLVDELGGYERALALLKEKVGIAASAPVQLVEFPERKSLWELLLSRAGAEQAYLPSVLARWLGQWEKLENLARRPLWAWLPVSFEFQ
jgi:protease-4